MSKITSTIGSLMAYVGSQNNAEQVVKGYSEAAYGLRAGHSDALPDLSEPPDQDTMEMKGARLAASQWQGWASLNAVDKEAFERAADGAAHAAERREAGELKHKPQPDEHAMAATGGERVAGYKPVSDAKAAQVNTMKMLEGRVLSALDGQLMKLNEEYGDWAKDFAAYQTNGFQRLSKLEQQAKLSEFAQREAEIKTALGWLTKGKQEIELGFMAVNRSIFRPEPVRVHDENQA